MATQIEDPAVAAYELLAPFYDLYTHDYGHDDWLANIEAIALEHGLSGRRLLDVGCGTGKSFVPMLALGYDVTAFLFLTLFGGPFLAVRGSTLTISSAFEVA